jgi:hypothetical protein
LLIRRGLPAFARTWCANHLADVPGKGNIDVCKSLNNPFVRQRIIAMTHLKRNSLLDVFLLNI